MQFEAVLNRYQILIVTHITRTVSLNMFERHLTHENFEIGICLLDKKQFVVHFLKFCYNVFLFSKIE